MEREEFEVGERVFVVNDGKPVRRTTVTEIKSYKRGPKVICQDGSAWDPRAGRRWGERSISFYTGPELRKSTSHLERQWRNAVTKSHLKRLTQLHFAGQLITRPEVSRFDQVAKLFSNLLKDAYCAHLPQSSCQHLFRCAHRSLLFLEPCVIGLLAER